MTFIIHNQYILGEEIKDDGLNDSKQLVSAGFIKSKWETVDPDQVEAQAMTTSKWDMLEPSQENSQDSSVNANDLDSSVDYTDTRFVYCILLT